MWSLTLVMCLQHVQQMWAPPVMERWFINPVNTIVIGTINHSYWSSWTLSSGPHFVGSLLRSDGWIPRPPPRGCHCLSLGQCSCSQRLADRLEHIHNKGWTKPRLITIMLNLAHVPRPLQDNVWYKILPLWASHRKVGIYITQIWLGPRVNMIHNCILTFGFMVDISD